VVTRHLRRVLCADCRRIGPKKLRALAAMVPPIADPL
jgi:hypothetical protein